MSGLFTVGDVTSFRAELAAVHDTLPAPQNRHLTLIDIRKMNVQAQEVVTAFSRIFTEQKYQSLRLAIVVSLSLTRSQVKRAAEWRSCQYFSTVAEAENWLLDEHRDAA